MTKEPDNIMKKLYNSTSLSSKEFVASTDKQKKMMRELKTRKDTEGLRMKRYLAMEDLSRTTGSPLKEIIEKVTKLSILKGFDKIKIPEIVPANISFDLFNFPPDHPARSTSDTYYVNKKNILRTHTTVMWYYYLNNKDIKEKVKQGEPIGVLSFGKVYRKDEIDRHHMNIFHQIDGLYLCENKYHEITQKDLQDVLVEIAKAIFGKDIRYRFNDDTFPYTNQSIEMEIDKNGKWVEVLGAGVVQPVVLEKLGVDSKQYNGWAFGFGLERLAIISMDLPDIRLFWSEDIRVKKQLKLGYKFIEVSKYPPIVRDISFIVKNDFVPNNYFDLVRETAPDLVEEVILLDKYKNAEKFGNNVLSYAFRITYRSTERTLTSTEVDILHKKLEAETVRIFGAKVR
ncbi:MAG: hypothetical protein NTX96_01320 [Candidatus Zambryskibacteria bacterium]|nr:hypothetical protein [Candidatus Zambryskibacteria bacterium]